MYKNYIDVRVLVNGRPAKEYSHKGLTLIESKHGSNYTIKIKNDNGYRIMAVVSVDGLDVLTGKPAENSKKGYIVDSYSSTVIKGYRLSDKDSAAFVFLKKGKSYSTSVTGDTRNTGVIGVRVFKEKESPVKIVERIIETTKYVPQPYPVVPYYPPYYNPWNPYWVTYSTGISGGTCTIGTSAGVIASSSTPIDGSSYTSGAGSLVLNCNNNSSQAAVFNYSSGDLNGGAVMCCSTGAGGSAIQARSIQTPGVKVSEIDNSFDSPITQDSFDTGTAWGKKQEDKIKKEYFSVGEILTEIVFYYATREALEKMGVDFDEAPKVSDHLPSAFGETNYCKPPKGWQG